MKTEIKNINDILPTDQEVSKWYTDNIDEDIATVSSSIYKFRLWMFDYLKDKLSPVHHNLGGFDYKENKKLKF